MSGTNVTISASGDASAPAMGQVVCQGDSSQYSPRPPIRIIRPTPGWRAIDLGELWKYRELLFFLTWRDVKVRYKQTVLGALWAILQPLMAMVVFSIFFGRLGRMDQQVDVAYPIFVFSGLLPWQFFSTAVSQGSQSLIAGSNLIGKVYFPRLIVPFSAVGAALVDFLICAAVMLGLMVWYQVPFTPHLLAVPLFVVGIIAAAIGMGTYLSALSVAYRDFRYVVPYLVQLWMFASPVAYPLSVVPRRWRMLYALNPMAGLIGGYRSAVLGEPFQWGPLSVSLVVAFLLLGWGVVYFRRVERRFADIV